MKKIVLFLLLVIFGGSFLHAQWVQTNGPYGGYIQAITSDGQNLYAGTFGAGIFVSTNNGNSWNPLNSILCSQKIISLNVINETMFAGHYTGGLLRSTNKGKTWITDTAYIRLELKPNSIIYKKVPLGSVYSVIESNHKLFAATRGSGIYRFNDTINCWIQVNNGLRYLGVSDLASSTDAVFAATELGVYYSKNDGANWYPINNGLIDSVFTHNIEAIAVNNNILFAGTDAFGVFRSTDFGATWIKASDGITNNRTNTIFANNGKVYVGTNGGLFVSSDNGISWNPINNGLTNKSISSVFSSNNILFAGTSGSGIYSSFDSGSNWTAKNIGITNSGIISFASYDNTIIAGSYTGEVFLSTDNGASWEQIYTNNYNNSIDALYANDEVILVGMFRNSILRSTDHGKSWANPKDSLSLMSFVEIGNNLYSGTFGGIYRSSDKGITWIPVNDGLTNTLVRGLAKTNNKIVAATEGGVFISNEEGNTWTSLPKVAATSWIMTATTIEDTIFIGTWGDGVFRLAINDNKWTTINNGLANKYIESLVTVNNTLFAGTDAGIFSSTNQGYLWKKIDEGLSGEFVEVLGCSGNYLFAGSRYKGVWYRPLSELITDVKQPKELPKQFYLEQNYPNPFNPTTIIKYSVPVETGYIPSLQYVMLKVYDLLGREVVTLVDEYKQPGTYEVKFASSHLERSREMASGVYFYTLHAGEYTNTRKMVLMK